MRIGSLFSGIGGLELGLEWAGLGETVWQVEQNEFCRRVLAKHWPEADRSVTDVRVAGRANLAPVDLICGGFPCQDVSSAGSGAGLAGARSGLWYEYLRIVGEVRPIAVIVENVASGAKRWLCEVRSNLLAIGYRSRAFAISAADVGAPHLRKRIFVIAADADPQGELTRADAEMARASKTVANANVQIQPKERSSTECVGVERPQIGRRAAGDHRQASADAESTRRKRPGSDSHEGWARSAEGTWGPPLGGLVPLVHGVSGGLAGRNRRERIRALGNSVVPQCAQAIGRMIMGVATMKLGLLFLLALAACASSPDPDPAPPTPDASADAVDETWPTLADCIMWPGLCATDGGAS